MDTLTLRLDRISHLIVAGWTGRDRAKVQHHIEELALLGVPAPSTTPQMPLSTASLSIWN